MSFIEKEREMQTKFKRVILFIFVLFTIGCANRKDVSPAPTIDDKLRRNLAAPINCTTAKRDIEAKIFVIKKACNIG